MAVLRELPAMFYTVQELGQMWHKRPASIRWWLLFMRRTGQGPGDDQVERKRLNACRRLVSYRADYVKLVEQSFMSRQRPCPQRPELRNAKP